jgi:hypothetical protein
MTNVNKEGSDIIIIVRDCMLLFVGYVTFKGLKIFSRYQCAIYSLPNIFRGIKLRELRWAGHVTRMREKEGCILGFGRDT